MRSACLRVAESRPLLLVAADDALAVLPQQPRLLEDVQGGVAEQLALDAVVVCAQQRSVAEHGHRNIVGRHAELQSTATVTHLNRAAT